LTDWIIHNSEYDWNSARRLPQYAHYGTGICDNDVRWHPDQFGDMLVYQLRIASDIPGLDLSITPVDPPQIAHTLPECLDPAFPHRVALVEGKQHADPLHLLRLLCPCGA